MSASLDPPCSGLIGGGWAAVERDGSIGCVPPNQVDHLLKEFDLFLRVPQATADGDALPRMRSQRVRDDGFHLAFGQGARSFRAGVNARSRGAGRGKPNRRQGDSASRARRISSRCGNSESTVVA